MSFGDAFEDVLARARAGDEAAFSRIFRDLQPGLLAYLRTLAPDAAEDVAAETWLQVVSGLDRFRGDESGFRGWVYTIARHRVADLRRRSRRWLIETTPAPSGLEEVADPGPGTAEQAEEWISTQAALELIAALPPDQAEVILLRTVAGLDVASTASVIGKRPGTVRVLAHRGLRRLAERLRSAPGETPGWPAVLPGSDHPRAGTAAARSASEAAARASRAVSPTAEATGATGEPPGTPRPRSTPTTCRASGPGSPTDQTGDGPGVGNGV